MATRINLRNPNTGIIKKACYGFSWTTLFFAFWPALLRGDFKWGLIGAFMWLIVGSFTAFIPSLIYLIVMAFIYNGIHARDLIEKGYQLSGTDTENALAAAALGISLPTSKATA